MQGRQGEGAVDVGAAVQNLKADHGPFLHLDVQGEGT